MKTLRLMMVCLFCIEQPLSDDYLFSKISSSSSSFFSSPTIITCLPRRRCTLSHSISVYWSSRFTLSPVARSMVLSCLFWLFIESCARLRQPRCHCTFSYDFHDCCFSRHDCFDTFGPAPFRENCIWSGGHHRQCFVSDRMQHFSLSGTIP